MKIDKEYPATHSMSTAWYFVDEDDNVALFDIAENGPVPLEAMNTDNTLSNLCFYEPQVKENEKVHLSFTEEQVRVMTENLWMDSVPEDYFWFDNLLMIDSNREEDFLAYLRHVRDEKGPYEWWDDSYVPVCLSHKQGIYLVDISDDETEGMANPHARFLFENKIALKCAMAPDWDCHTGLMDDRTKLSGCPYFIYWNGTDSSEPHQRLHIPLHPMKLNQFPKAIKDRVITLPLKFSQHPTIQIAAEHLCYTSQDTKTIADGVAYVNVQLPSGENVWVRNLASDDHMAERFCKDGKAQEVVDLLNRYPKMLTQQQMDAIKEHGYE